MFVGVGVGVVADEFPVALADGHLLAEHEPEAPGGPGAKVAHMVVVELAVDRIVHGHRRHGDAVAQGHTLQSVR